MKFADYQNREIELSEDSWQHIQDSHPEITLEHIRSVLASPSAVVECPRQNFVELFYQIKLYPAGKQRFHLVVVKIMADGNFISTAMTTSSLKKGRTLFRQGAE